MTTDQAGGTAGRRADLYTPEAVRVDLPLADLGSRSLAILLDLFLMGVLYYLLLLAVILAGGIVGAADAVAGGPGWILTVLIVAFTFAILWGYPVVLETRLRGRTPGKAALGLRVVTVDGGPVRFRHAALRGLMTIFDFYAFAGIPALITALVTKKGQRLGDLVAGTVTIRDRESGGTAAQAVQFVIPPALLAYAGTLDVRGLTAADYAGVRRFLLRAGSLEPEHRTRVATDLANVLANRMAHRPPAGTHPEALLLCVAALMQQQGAVQAAPPWSPPSAPTPGPGPVAPPPHARSDRVPGRGQVPETGPGRGPESDGGFTAPL
ncbi:RDD family protein [Euzebya tangerina]|uniref:RDD family protein n=1 Tax=Euzebya tangerina TaxID=591198 RepID=UPI0013C33E94|nr:RDD family protein [Euzebya tangerina]